MPFTPSLTRPPPVQKTILVVDDDVQVLNSISRFLSTGYKVLTSSGGYDAIRQSRNHAGDIHLLLADFQMPEMNGIDLAIALTNQRPHIQTLLMSAFSDGTLVLNDGWHFLYTPFFPSQLRTLIVGLIDPRKASRFAT